jgi:hypothetical protein
MRTQRIRNSESSSSHPLTAGLAAAALLALLVPIAAARAASLSELVFTAPLAGAELAWSDLEVAVSADLVPSAEPDFGTAGLTVTGPLTAADGESSGMVFYWTAMAKDPAYLVSATSLFSSGVGSWPAGDESLWVLPDLGVVPRGNLSVFASGAVDLISWNFLEFSYALLALRLEDYLRLRKVLDPADLDDPDGRASAARLSAAWSSGMGGRLSPVPDPTTSLLMGQGLVILALLGPHLSPRRAEGEPDRPQGTGSAEAPLPRR